MKQLLIVIFYISTACCFAQQAVFYCEKPTFKFPKTEEGIQLSHDYIIENKGNIPLVFDEYEVGCPCTKVTLPPPIPPNSKGIVSITFDSNHKYYQQDRRIKLYITNQEKPELLRFKVYVIPKKED